jgi:23S rRNA-/tRNA-specific pseudouridylate synthase
MIVTKCKMVAGKLTRMFQKRKARKTYVALCIGKRPPWDEIYVETGHGRSRWGAWRVYANEDIGRKLPEKASVKDMATRFEVLSVNGESVAPRCRETPEGDGLYCERRVAERDKPYENVLSASGDEIIVRAFPVTGRTHQIRLHCQFLGIPLLGDVKYGGPLVWKGSSYEAHTLHAESMSFRHPVTNEELSLLAPLPEWAALRC